MTRADVDRKIVELGWLTLTHRALGGRPAESYALRHLMRCAGRGVSSDELASDYADFARSGGCIIRSCARERTSRRAVTTRIARLRAALADLGVREAIHTLGPYTYAIWRGDVPRIEAAVLFAAGFAAEALAA